MIFRVFAIEEETNNYGLHVKGYNTDSTAGNTLLTDSNSNNHDKMQFTTKDGDND